MSKSTAPSRLLSLFEGWLAGLSFDERIDALVTLLDGEELPRSQKDTIQDFAFRRAFDRLRASGSIDDAAVRGAAMQSISQMIQAEVDRRVAAALTRDIGPVGRPRTGRLPRSVGIHLVFQKAEEPIAASTLAEFLELFTTVYSACLDLPILDDAKGRDFRPILTIPSLQRSVSQRLADEPDRGSVVRASSHGAGRNDVMIVALQKSSPLELWLGGQSVALLAAVVISGGEVDLSKGHFKLHSLGDGLTKLLRFWREVQQRPDVKASATLPRRRRHRSKSGKRRPKA